MRTITAVVVSLAALTMATYTSARPIDSHSAAATHRSKVEQKYLKLYWQVVRADGRRAPGRNLVTRGVVTSRHRIRDAHRVELGRSIRTFERWLAPPIAPVARVDRVAHGQAPAYSGGAWAIPASIVMCESGGNYNAVNSSSGARGAYQLMPSTYYANGGDGSWSPADQDRVAARVWAGGAGRSQWSC